MGTPEDVQFLALLVHRGHLPREGAEAVLARLKEGVPLDRALVETAGLSPEEVARLRRTRAGEIPEIPGYEIQARLGTGGTADVFRAVERKTGRTLALKVLRPDKARHEPTRKAFIAEAKLLQRLEHPGLVRGFGVARYKNLFFNRLELVDGHTLLELLDEGRAFEEDVALRILLEVAETLAYLAGEGVVHRDVKPGNIMLSSNGQVKLIDLGFAAGDSEAPAESDTTVGTPEYLSPEQARGGAADMRSDIYSLGVTLFHLVVGKLPFESSDDREVLRMQIMDSLSSPELKSRGFSAHLHYFIEKMMAKNREDRYQSWTELIEDIRGQLAGRESLDFERAAREETGPGRPRRRP